MDTLDWTIASCLTGFTGGAYWLLVLLMELTGVTDGAYWLLVLLAEYATCRWCSIAIARTIKTLSNRNKFNGLDAGRTLANDIKGILYHTSHRCFHARKAKYIQRNRQLCCRHFLTELHTLLTVGSQQCRQYRQTEESSPTKSRKWSLLHVANNPTLVQVYTEKVCESLFSQNNPILHDTRSGRKNRFCVHYWGLMEFSE